MLGSISVNHCISLLCCRHGRYNSCRRLLECTNGTNTVNETDALGQTPLHEAAANGHVKVVQLLLQFGALITRSGRLRLFTPDTKRQTDAVFRCAASAQQSSM